MCTELPSKSAARDHSAPAEAGAEWKALETVHTRAQAHVRLASVESAWKGIAVSRFRLGQNDVCLPPLRVPAFGVSYGAPAQLERICNGLRVSGTVTPGRLAILPPDAGTRWIFERTGDVA